MPINFSGLLNCSNDFFGDMLGYSMVAHGAVDLTFPAGMRVQDDVLAGFADFAGRRGALLPWWQRLLPGWRKIALTAGRCRRLQREGLVSYVLVTARRR